MPANAFCLIVFTLPKRDVSSRRAANRNAPSTSRVSPVGQTSMICKTPLDNPARRDNQGLPVCPPPRFASPARFVLKVQSDSISALKRCCRKGRISSVSQIRKKQLQETVCRIPPGDFVTHLNHKPSTGEPADRQPTISARGAARRNTDRRSHKRTPFGSKSGEVVDILIGSPLYRLLSTLQRAQHLKS